MFRTVGDADEVLVALRALEPQVEIEEVLRVPPVQLQTIPGFAAAASVHDGYSVAGPVGCAAALRTRLGPARAHGGGIPEFDELEAAVDAYERIVTALSP